MTVKDIAQRLGLKVFSGDAGLDNEVTGGYVSDLLSDVMGHARAGELWITLQTHRNVTGVASLRELAGVVLVKGFEPDEDMLEMARSEGIPVLGTELGTFDLAGRLYEVLK